MRIALVTHRYDRRGGREWESWRRSQKLLELRGWKYTRFAATSSRLSA